MAGKVRGAHPPSLPACDSHLCSSSTREQRCSYSLQIPFLFCKIHPKPVGTTALHCSFRLPGQSTLSSITSAEVRRGSRGMFSHGRNLDQQPPSGHSFRVTDLSSVLSPFEQAKQKRRSPRVMWLAGLNCKVQLAWPCAESEI